MKMLLDECLPKKLAEFLIEFEVKTVTEMGWRSKKNGELIKAAEENGFDVLLTVDKNIKHQQNSDNIKISIAVFDVLRNKIEFLTPLIPVFIEKIKDFRKGIIYRIG
jgi:predicted nuclease of predicted toxin-antitoxin system